MARSTLGPGWGTALPLTLTLVLACRGAPPVIDQGSLPPRELTIHGTIVDEMTGEPVQATVEASVPHGSRSVSGRADRTGAYEVRIASDTVTVTVRAPGHRPERRVVPWPYYIPHRARLDFLVRPDEQPSEPSRPTCAVTGLVRDQETGREIWSVRLSLPDLPAFRFDTRESGRFVLLNVPSGLQRILARRVGYEDEEREILVHCSDVRAAPHVTFLMREAAMHLF